jgi:IclR family pca regulon transcriptional regulator
MLSKTPSSSVKTVTWDMPQRDPVNFVTALARGLDVLFCFNEERRKQTLSQVAAATNLSRGTARRMLLTLSALGYVETDGKFFTLKPKVLELAKAYFTSHGLAEVARPFVRSITEQTGENSAVAVLDGRDIVYIARAEARRIFSSGLEPGSRIAANCASMGQVLLAALENDRLERWLASEPLVARTPHSIADPDMLRARLQKVRDTGYAFIDGEIEMGLISLAVPITTPGGETIAALSVGALSARVSEKRMREDFLPILKLAARDIGAAFVGL